VALCEHLTEWLGAPRFEAAGTAPFDGGHEALAHSIALFTGPRGDRRDTVAFAVPSYPYWTAVAASDRRGLALEAYDAPGFLAALARADPDRVGAVILPWPNNPLGYSFSEDEVAQLNALSRARGWGMVIDLAYYPFLDHAERAALRALDVDRTVFCISVSKAWCSPGLRLGFALTSAELGPILRARKAGQAMFPSALKQAFLGYLLAHRPDLPQRVVATVMERRRALRTALASLIEPELGISLSARATSGLYEIVHIDDHCAATGDSAQRVALHLKERAGVRVRTPISFYPPGSAATRHQFLRLAVGLVADIEPGARALVGYFRDRHREPAIVP
ncbi:MAG TPA: pyridoxal phosphate-dependent aminotransferase, partial [Kofleriaceae bacterium]|nr:pyridoxal phosphate-dependent aminotransferase [Kofleriaceae bacterium]